MAGIICKQCGYENPEGSTICEICAEELVSSKESVQTEVSQVINKEQESINGSPDTITNNIRQATEQQINDGREYYVICPESQTKTVLPNGNVTSFFCEGCKKEHDIDGFLWNIESNELEKINNNQSTVTASNCFDKESSPKGDNLYLEEMNSHYRIDIDKAGGILGRYGKYGADYFQSRGLLTVSGEHCSISYEFGNWVIRHISRTNETRYNNMVLGTNEPNLLEDGKVLTLANTVSFIVRIG